MATYGNTTWGIVRHNFHPTVDESKTLKQMCHDFSLNFNLNRIATTHPIPTPPFRYHVGDCWPRINQLCDSWCDWLIDWSAFTSESIQLVSTPPPPQTKKDIEKIPSQQVRTVPLESPGDQIVYLPTGLKSCLLWVWCFLVLALVKIRQHLLA